MGKSLSPSNDQTCFCRIHLLKKGAVPFDQGTKSGNNQQQAGTANDFGYLEAVANPAYPNTYPICTQTKCRPETCWSFTLHHPKKNMLCLVWPRPKKVPPRSIRHSSISVPRPPAGYHPFVSRRPREFEQRRVPATVWQSMEITNIQRNLGMIGMRWWWRWDTNLEDYWNVYIIYIYIYIYVYETLYIYTHIFTILAFPCCKKDILPWHKCL